MRVARWRQLVDREHPSLSITRQCALLGVSRSGVYYRPRERSEEDLALMQAMDRQYLETPFYGSRRMKGWLEREGSCVSRKRVQRLMRIMGLRAIYRGPRTSRPVPEHRVYPYLLEKARITRPNQVWAADITYLPMAPGFLYLVAIMDWHSRYVGPGGCPTHWRRTSAWMPCKRRLGRAGPRCSTPTRAASSPAGTLQDHEVRISMDWKGRYTDNIFVERL